MRWRALAVAALLVASGCNAFAGGASEPTTRTLTPAPIPSAAAGTTRPSPGPTNCVAPPAAAPDERATPTTPATPRPLPRIGNGTGPVDGSALVDRHDRALRNDSYHLDAGDELTVTAMAGGRAFTLSGVVAGLYFTDVYAVGGTAYVHVRRPDGTRYVWETPVDTPGLSRFLPSLTGAERLADIVGPYNYTVTGTRSWNGTTVRVLKVRLDTPAEVDGKRVMDVRSTVLVDRRGIVRYVDHYERFRYVFESGDSVHVTDTSFSVTAVGSATIRRPAVFCGVEWTDVRAGTPAGIAGRVTTTASETRPTG